MSIVRRTTDRSLLLRLPGLRDRDLRIRDALGFRLWLVMDRQLPRDAAGELAQSRLAVAPDDLLEPERAQLRVVVRDVIAPRQVPDVHQVRDDDDVRVRGPKALRDGADEEPRGASPRRHELRVVPRARPLVRPRGVHEGVVEMRAAELAHQVREGAAYVAVAGAAFL